MSIEIVGSRDKSQTARGQNQDQTGSWTKEKSLAPIPKVSVPNPTVANANAADDAARLAQIQGHPVKAHVGMRTRGLDDTGSPTGKVPAETVRRSKTDGIARPVNK